MDDENKPILSFELMLGIFFGIILMTATLWATSSYTWLYQDGYYEAYKQFKEGKLEQSVSNTIKLRYETELLQQKYKDK